MHSSEDDPDPKHLTVLFAEDDPLLRELVGTRLRIQGYHVIETETGDEALPVLQRGGIDVLLTDISMPGTLDGWSLAEHARNIDPGIAIVYSSSRPADAARQLGGSLFVRKPCRPEEIVDAIRLVTSREDDERPGE